MRALSILAFLALTACQTTDIKQAYVDPNANIGAAESAQPSGPVSAPSAAAQVVTTPDGASASSAGELNSTSWVELRLADAPRPAPTRPPVIRAPRSQERPLALLTAPGELMNPAEFPTRFLAKQ